MHRTANIPAQGSWLTADLRLLFTNRRIQPTVDRWAVLSAQIPGDDQFNIFNKCNPAKHTGRPTLNLRVLIGAVVIKHVLNLDDRETVAQISENMYPAELDRFFNTFSDTAHLSTKLPYMHLFSWSSICLRDTREVNAFAEKKAVINFPKNFIHLCCRTSLPLLCNFIY